MKPYLFALSFLLLAACETDENDPASPSYNASPSHSVRSGSAEDGAYVAEPAPGEQYNEYVENPFVEAAQEPVSTFSMDADGASYANVRRFLSDNYRPPVEAIRTEEFVNYFPYDYPEPTDGSPIGLNGEISSCPWQKENRLIRVGIKGRTVAASELPVANWVLLVDVSGSMGGPDKLELLQQGLVQFVEQMRPDDQLALVTYAGSAGVVLDATPGREQTKIRQAIAALSAGGSTAGAAGINTAYDIAEAHFIEGGNNRVILASDGDFNVGPASQEELVSLIEEKRDRGIFLTVLGLGSGNLNEAAMEQIANHGNGTYEYLDNLAQCEKVFIHEYGKFLTVAKDVKVQLTFNPDVVQRYRLIGYENRLLNEEDFEDDQKDAGEIGSGQTITALYEVVPATGLPDIALRRTTAFTVDFRYQHPDEAQAQPLRLEITDAGTAFVDASDNHRFAASVAGLAMLLMDSPYRGELQYAQVMEWANGARQYDPYDLRRGFISMVERAQDF